MPSEREVRRVIAFAFRRDDGRYLLVKRRADIEEYPGEWSLPTVRVAEADWQDARAGKKVADLLSRKYGPSLVTGAQIVAEAHRDRSGYQLSMLLAVVDAPSPPPALSPKYVDWQYVLPAELPPHFPHGGGCCVSMLIQHLIDQRLLSTAVQFTEVAPHQLSLSLESIQGVDLWRKGGALQYRRYLREGGVKSGVVIKQMTVDRYLASRLTELSATVKIAVDLGCGDGKWVRDLRGFGLKSFGVDVDPEIEADDAGSIVQGSIETATSFVPLPVDLIILHLVLQWIDDLGDLMRVVRALSKPGTRVISTVVPSEFSKNGDWVRNGTNWSWLISKPLRRPPELTMINHSVGPLKLYPRALPEYFQAFGQSGFTCDRSEYIYLDSFAHSDELEEVLAQDRDLERHVQHPCFVAFEHVRQ